MSNIVRAKRRKDGDPEGRGVASPDRRAATPRTGRLSGMSLPIQPGMRPSDEERAYVEYLLQEAYSSGRITLEEFKLRQERALTTTNSHDFIDLLHDLPEGAAVVAALGGHPPSPGARPTAVGGGLRSLAVFSEKQLNVPPGEHRVDALSLISEHDVDLASALGPGQTVEIRVLSLFAETTIYVPPGVQIVNQITSVVGEVKIARKARGNGENGTLLLNGFCLFGEVRVKLSKRHPRPATRNPWPRIPPSPNSPAFPR